MKYSERTTDIKHIMHQHNIIHFVGYIKVPHTSLKSGLTVNSTVVLLPVQPISFHLTSSLQSYTVGVFCFFGGLSSTDECRALSASMMWIKTHVLPKICKLAISFTVLKKKSDILMQSFFLLTHQYTIYMKQCIPFWSIHLSFISAETQSVFASASSWIAAEWCHHLHGGALFLDLDFALDLLEDNL